MDFLSKPQRVFKRPSIRFQHNAPTPPFVRPTKGVVFDIINIPKLYPAKPKPLIAQERSEEYLRDLEKNYEYHGIPFKRPNVIELVPRHKTPVEPEKHIEYLDQVQVNLCVLKNGKIRVKLVLHLAQLYEKYYSHGKGPPIKALTTAYKNLGYSDTFIESFVEKHKKRVVFGKKLDKILENIFDKSANAKKKPPPPPKKKPPVEDDEEVEEPEDDEEEEEEEDGPEEDEAIVADDEEDEEEEIVEDIEPVDFD